MEDKFLRIKTPFLTNVFGSGGCASCDADTAAPEVPVYLAGVSPKKVLQGGIAGWAAIHCSVGAFNDITDQAEWDALVAAGKIRGRLNGCRIQGGKPASDQETSTRGSCGTEEVISVTDTFTLTDLENDDELSANALYEFFACSTEWKFIFITCDYRVYDVISSASYVATTNFIESDTNSADSFWQLEVKVKRSACDSLGMVYVPWLENYTNTIMGN